MRWPTTSPRFQSSKGIHTVDRVRCVEEAEESQGEETRHAAVADASHLPWASTAGGPPWWSVLSAVADPRGDRRPRDTAGADRRQSRQINAGRDWQSQVVRVTRGRRRPLASIAVSSSGDRRPGMRPRRGVAPPAWHLSPRLLPLSVPLTRGAHSHKSHLLSGIERGFQPRRTHLAHGTHLASSPRACRSRFSVYGAVCSHRPQRMSVWIGARVTPELCHRVNERGEWWFRGWLFRVLWRFFRCSSPWCDVSVAKDAPPFSYRQARSIALRRARWGIRRNTYLSLRWRYHWRSCVSAIPSRGYDASPRVILLVVDTILQFRRNLDATVTYLARENDLARWPSNSD